jgi:hypothetical protein
MMKPGFCAVAMELKPITRASKIETDAIRERDLGTIGVPPFRGCGGILHPKWVELQLAVPDSWYQAERDRAVQTILQ